MLGRPALYDDVAELEARGDADAAMRRAGAARARRERRGDRGAARAARPWRPPLARRRREVLHRRRDRHRHRLAVRARPHGEGTAPFWPDPGRYAEVVARFARAGFQCATHAIGDRAVATALDAYRDAGPGGGAPHRIEHIETLRDAELARFAAEGVAASMQPLHAAHLDEPGPFRWRDNLRPEQVAAGFRWADLRRSGAILALGSDWPVVSADPRIGLAWRSCAAPQAGPSGRRSRLPRR